jgi:hypothetical protein
MYKISFVGEGDKQQTFVVASEHNFVYDDGQLFVQNDDSNNWILYNLENGSEITFEPISEVHGTTIIFISDKK